MSAGTLKIWRIWFVRHFFFCFYFFPFSFFGKHRKFFSRFFCRYFAILRCLGRFNIGQFILWSARQPETGMQFCSSFILCSVVFFLLRFVFRQCCYVFICHVVCVWSRRFFYFFRFNFLFCGTSFFVAVVVVLSFNGQVVCAQNWWPRTFLFPHRIYVVATFICEEWISALTKD